MTPRRALGGASEVMRTAEDEGPRRFFAKSEKKGRENMHEKRDQTIIAALGDCLTLGD